ncbi:DUF4259 domain-containing protein [Isobaculum melis]|uniref:DUF4259 domain-containing protein n=1 Tax=Isobaculum melis TaxID=142588 RepID=A0A1H9PVL1_9LACT|nr:DUF4259 domain-containing protein [Isobaculum melis]SER51865.1 protein of unknown function [Isobaculum melis]
MGAWGIKALESDEGLDVVSAIGQYIEEENISVFNLQQITQQLVELGFMTENLNEEEEFLYDNSTIALAELTLQMVKKEPFIYEELKKLKSYNIQKEAIQFLITFIQKIDDTHELVALYFNQETIKNYLKELVAELIELEKNC